MVVNNNLPVRCVTIASRCFKQYDLRRNERNLYRNPGERWYDPGLPVVCEQCGGWYECSNVHTNCPVNGDVVTVVLTSDATPQCYRQPRYQQRHHDGGEQQPAGERDDRFPMLQTIRSVPEPA